MKTGYLTILNYVTLFVVPIGLGLMLTAEDFILLFCSETWAPAIPATQIIAIYGITYALTYNNVFNDLILRIN